MRNIFLETLPRLPGESPMVASSVSSGEDGWGYVASAGYFSKCGPLGRNVRHRRRLVVNIFFKSGWILPSVADSLGYLNVATRFPKIVTKFIRNSCQII
jgi:hypothetical protein